MCRELFQNVENLGNVVTRLVRFLRREILVEGINMIKATMLSGL